MLEIEIVNTMLAAICGASNISPSSDGVMVESCQTCPSFTSNSGNPGGTIEQIIYGSFTAPGLDEALVDLGDCEPHVNNWGGSILLRRSDQEWSMVQYEPGLRSLSCLTFSQDGLDSVVCEHSYINQGYLVNWLNQLEFEPDRIGRTELINVTSNTGSCRPPFYSVEIVETQSQDVNNDGLSDLVAVLTEARETSPENESQQIRCEPNLPAPTIHELTFLFDGRSFTPTSETRAKIADIQSIGN